MAFTTLAHHLDQEWLQDAYRWTCKDAAVGVDGQTGLEYAEQLEENLRSLLARAKSGDHDKAPTVRRFCIPGGREGTARVNPSRGPQGWSVKLGPQRLRQAHGRNLWVGEPRQSYFTCFLDHPAISQTHS
jgi:hypothetical protein